VQQRAAKLVNVFKNRSYAKHTKLLNLTTLETRMKTGDLIEAYKIITGNLRGRRIGELVHDY